MKRVLLFLSISLCILITGCSNDNKKIALPKSESSDSKIIFNRFIQKMLSYNTKTFKVEQQSNIDSYMQYEFNSKSNFYTVGHSIKNGFEILCIDNNEIKSVYKLEDQKNEGIFPLATNGTRKIFIREFEDNTGKEIKRRITEYTNGKLIDFQNVDGLVSYGALLSNVLYYTIYDDKTDSFILYSINVSDYSNKPQKIKVNLLAGELYIHNNQLFVSDKDTIYNDNQMFRKRSLNYFFDEYNILVQLYIGKQSSLQLDIVDTRSKKILNYSTDVIDFSIDKNELTVYCHGHIDKFHLE